MRMIKTGKQIAALLMGFLVAASFITVSAAEVIEYPVSAEAANPINSEYYLSDTEYKDPSIHVVISEGRAFKTDYMVIRISVQNGTQIRTALDSRNGKSESHATSIAKRANAVFAINGDNFSNSQPAPYRYVVRQGRVLKHNAKGELDVLIIDEAGNFHAFRKPEQKELESFGGTVVNALCFGPVLMAEGEPVPVTQDKRLASEIPAQRMALCQCVPSDPDYALEYACVVSAGPQNPGSTGMTLYEFAEVVASVDGLITAFNLDGGSSATAVFKNSKINAFGSGKTRSVNDIVYFASAWTEE